MGTIWTDMANAIPEGKRGIAEVRHVEVTPRDAAFTRIRAVATGGRESPVGVGTYAQLRVNRQLVMSDTQMERRTNAHVIRLAKGHVLIAGLGLGMILLPMLAKPEVEHITVVELSGDVIALVEPHVRAMVGSKVAAEKLAVIEADIFEWKPPRGARWDLIYFDIWPTICSENLAEMTTLHRRFGRRKAPGGWMGSWEQTACQRLRRQERKDERAYSIFRR